MKSKNSMNSVSPVSPTREDLDSALDVLNASIDSGLIAQMVHSGMKLGESTPGGDNSPSNIVSDGMFFSRPEVDSSIIAKCQMVLSDLQKELDRERDRSRDLDLRLEQTMLDLSELRDQHSALTAAKSLADSRLAELEKEHFRLVDIHAKEILDLTNLVQERQKAAERKDFELENMTRHFERRLDEMKKQTKALTMMSVSAISTPPIPAAPSRSPELDQEIGKLRSELSYSLNALTLKDDEIRTVVECFERQIAQLKEQLRSSKAFFKNYYSSKAAAHHN